LQELSGAQAKLRLDRVAIARNNLNIVLITSGPSLADITHTTVARNFYRKMAILLCTAPYLQVWRLVIQWVVMWKCKIPSLMTLLEFKNIVAVFTGLQFS
jgi:hypothetical protein